MASASRMEGVRMNFVEAVKHAESAGCAVRLRSWSAGWGVWVSKQDGAGEAYRWISITEPRVAARTYTPTFTDIVSDDWEVVP